MGISGSQLGMDRRAGWLSTGKRVLPPSKTTVFIPPWHIGRRYRRMWPLAVFTRPQEAHAQSSLQQNPTTTTTAWNEMSPSKIEIAYRLLPVVMGQSKRTNPPGGNNFRVAHTGIVKQMRSEGYPDLDY